MATDLDTAISADSFVPLYADSAILTFTGGDGLLSESMPGGDVTTPWTNWADGEPTVYSSNDRRCVYMDETTEQWKVHACTDYNAFACEVHTLGE